MEWRPAGWSVCLPLLISLCTMKSRSSLLAPAHPDGPGKRAAKGLWWCAPFCGGDGSPSNTMSPGPRPMSLPSGILIRPAVWLQQTWAENGEELCPLFWGELGPQLTQYGQGQGLPLYLYTLYHLDLSSRLATIDMGRKVGWGCCAPLGRAWSPSNTMWSGPRPTSAPSDPAIWPQYMSRKVWGLLCPLFAGAKLGPSLTQSHSVAWLRPTFVPSVILIHPTVWPQYTNVTDRQPTALDRQRSDSIG